MRILALAILTTVTGLTPAPAEAQRYGGTPSAYTSTTGMEAIVTIVAISQCRSVPLRHRVSRPRALPIHTMRTRMRPRYQIIGGRVALTEYHRLRRLV